MRKAAIRPDHFGLAPGTFLGPGAGAGASLGLTSGGDRPVLRAGGAEDLPEVERAPEVNRASTLDRNPLSSASRRAAGARLRPRAADQIEVDGRQLDDEQPRRRQRGEGRD